MNASTHYDTLQVAETASEEVIKGAYRYLSQKWHPDKNPDQREEAERVMRAINQAYAVLSDPARRREYDAWLVARRAHAGQAGGASAGPQGQASGPHGHGGISQRERYAKALSSSYAVATIWAFFFVVALILAASASSYVALFLIAHPVRAWLVAVCLPAWGIETLFAEHKKRRLMQEDMAVLEQMYTRHEQTAGAKLILYGISWLVMAGLVFSYPDALASRYANASGSSSSQAPSAPAPQTQRPAAPSAPAPASLPLTVRNDCHRPVEIRIHYLAADNRWQTKGAYSFQPGESARLTTDDTSGAVIQSASGIFYYHARSTDGEYLWEGDEANPEDKSVAIRDFLFRFRKARLARNDQGAYLLPLHCGGSRS